jgi:tetratricopeptide (TPR) repeat protein
MSPVFPILAGVAILAIGGFMILLISRKSKPSAGAEGEPARPKKLKNKDAAVKNATKRLAQNPRDAEALSTLGDVYYEEGNWERAFKSYESLLELGGVAEGINEFEANLRYGQCALKQGLGNEAYKGFSQARAMRQDNFEVNYNLGVLEFQKKNYEKAIQLLQSARSQAPDHPPTLRYLGHSFFRMKKPKEAMAFIRKAIELAPEDRESLYTLAECYHEANQTEQALKIFGHLRADPTLGANACLHSGTINMEQRQYARAIQDFEIGLKHEAIKPEVLLDLRYRLANAYLRQNDIGRAIPLLRDIQAFNPSYKDVPILISKYQELNANKNLQIFMIAPSADFVALCRKIVMTYYPKAKVKISNISVNKNEWADILAEIDTPKWSDVVMFRFIRTQGSVGELVVRDFHSHLKEVKAGKGICITVGSFSDEAKRYTEARLIDLIEKDRLSVILNTVDSKTQVGTGAKSPVRK